MTLSKPQKILSHVTLMLLDVYSTNYYSSILLRDHLFANRSYVFLFGRCQVKLKVNEVPTWIDTLCRVCRRTPLQ